MRIETGRDVERSGVNTCARSDQVAQKRSLNPGESVVSIVDDAEPRFTTSCWLYDNRLGSGDVLDYQLIGATDETNRKKSGCDGVRPRNL